jgi:hypothetical protein
MTAAPLDFAALDDRAALYYLALDFEPVAEPHALHVLPFCGLPDPTPEPLWDPAIRPPERCPFHGGAPLYLGDQGPECALCERARHEARGCRCGGTGKAPDVLAGEPRPEGSSSRCEVCSSS